MARGRRRRAVTCGGKGCRNPVIPGRYVCESCEKVLAPIRKALAEDPRSYNSRPAVRPREAAHDDVETIEDEDLT